MSLQANHCVGKRSRDGHADSNTLLLQLQIHRRIEICLLGRTYFLDGVPILVPAFCLTWLQEAEIWLVIGINPSHDFNVWRELAACACVSQISIPGVAEFVITPCPLLFPGSNMVVCIVHHTRIRRKIVTTEKIFR